MKYSMLCLTILLLNGCDSDANRSDHVSTGLFITTDKTEYLRNEKTIITFINNTDQTVIFEGCLSDIFYYRDKWVENQWVEWTNLSCSDTSLIQFALRPHTSTSDSVVVRKPGEYRLRYPIHWNDQQNTPDTMSSNSFTIH